MRFYIIALPVIAILGTVIFESVPAEAVPQGVSCGRRVSVLATGYSKSKARKACYRKLQDWGRSLYGSAYWGLNNPSSACKPYSGEWACSCSANHCWRRYILKRFDKGTISKRFRFDRSDDLRQLRRRRPGRVPSGRPTLRRRR